MFRRILGGINRASHWNWETHSFEQMDAGQNRVDQNELANVCFSLCQSLMSGSVDHETARSQCSYLLSGMAGSDTTFANSLKDLTNGLLEHLLKAVEVCKNESVRILLIQILLRFALENKRNKRIFAQCNASQRLLKMFVSIAPMRDTCEESLSSISELLLHMDTRDRLGVKARLAGVLNIAAQIVCKNPTTSPLTPSLLALLQLCCQNNAQNCFVLTKSDLVSFFQRTLSTASKQSFQVLRPSLVLLFLIVRSRKCNAKLISAGFISSLLRIVLTQFPLLVNQTSADAEVVLIAVANLRIFSKTKLGRDELVNQGCPQALANLLSAEITLENSQREGYTELVSNICAICERCLQLKQLDLPCAEHPVKFQLPSVPKWKRQLSSAFHRFDDIDSGNDDMSDGEEADDSGPTIEKIDGISLASPSAQMESFYKKLLPELYESEATPQANNMADEFNNLSTQLEPLSLYGVPEKPVSLSRLRSLDADSSLGPGSLRELCKNKVEHGVPTLSGKLNKRANSVVLERRHVHAKNTPSRRHTSLSVCITPPLPRSISTKCRSRTCPPTLHKDSKQQRVYTMKHNALPPQQMVNLANSTSLASNNALLNGPTTSNARPKFSYTKDDYAACANSTVMITPCVRLAYPDLSWGYPNLPLQPLKFFPDALRRQVLSEVQAQTEVKHQLYPCVVYDLDEIVKCPPPEGICSEFDWCVQKSANTFIKSLKFESRFESGNLRKAIQIGPLEYDLLLSPDINQVSMHAQWFYFSVSNMQSDTPYQFNIINFVKGTSQFSEGMQPVVFSVTEAMQGRPGWARSCHSISYYRNRFFLASSNDKQRRDSLPTFATLTFAVSFRHALDVCYIAFHYPYTFTTLQCHLQQLAHIAANNAELYFDNRNLCNTMSGNAVPVLTITSALNSASDVAQRRYIVLSSRIHPGESNSSWMMLGTLRFLLSNNVKAKTLRERFVFKVVPMLNPDGVVNGSHRCNLSGHDLNRQWTTPSKDFHPTVFHLKGLIQFLCSYGKTPWLYCDFHGHSKRKNIFLLGNNPKQSWLDSDKDVLEPSDFMELARILEEEATGFSLNLSRFSIEKGKEGTSRVAVWRQFGIAKAYTMEATFCGFDKGVYKGFHIGTKELLEMGEQFCKALLTLDDREKANAIRFVSTTADDETDSELHFTRGGDSDSG